MFCEFGLIKLRYSKCKRTSSMEYICHIFSCF